MYGVELMLMIVATIGCALSANTVRGIDVVTMLVFWRVVLGGAFFVLRLD
jgi:PHS family inorganic phosphate transporter-like MFS transporter